MKPLILSLAVLTTLSYLTNSFNPTAHKTTAETETTAIAQPPHVVQPTDIVVASASSYNRWKTGPTAQNDWKIGPNAQTQFEAFAPMEQADWNHSPGYSIVAGATLRPTVIRR